MYGVPENWHLKESTRAPCTRDFWTEGGTRAPGVGRYLTETGYRRRENLNEGPAMGLDVREMGVT